MYTPQKKKRQTKKKKPKKEQKANKDGTKKHTSENQNASI